ncbi:MAG TPA: HIT domain-containing protein [Candidatus Saccharimonadales bacterium]|jgi:histidine triad (HIT) family protein
MQDSIFTKIIKGELPCHKVYEDDRTIAFLPLYPVARGHVLVVPKRQVEQFYDLPPADYDALMETVKKVALRMKEVLGTKRVGLKVEGLEVPHVHVHVLAFDTHEQYDEHPDQSGEPDHTALEAMAKKLTF